jgi:hypothetical protein
MVPPEVIADTTALLLVWHTGEPMMVHTTEGGECNAARVTLDVETHPHESVTVTEYVPGPRLDMVGVI